MRALSFLLVITLTAALAAGPAAAQSFQGLGVPEGANDTRAWDVSGDGAVVVGAIWPYEAFRWEDGTLTALGAGSFDRSDALGVSGDGELVAGLVMETGVGRDGALHDGQGWTVIGGTEQLFALSADGTTAVGERRVPRAFEAVRVVNGSVEGLGFLWAGDPEDDGDDRESKAYGVSADGSIVVGQSAAGELASGITIEEAFIWRDGVMTGLGYLPSPYADSRARDVSDDGRVVVGHSVTEEGPNMPVRWVDGRIERLGLLPGANQGFAYGVTANGGVIVGESDLNAFVWTEGAGIRRLQDVLENDHGLDLTGWHLTSAQAISDDGRVVVGYGINPTGQTEAFRAAFWGDELVVNDTRDLADYDPDDRRCDAVDDEDEAGNQCTLRAAIEEANARGGGEIAFDIEADGIPRIVVDAPLPTVAQTVAIDGGTQPGEGRVEVDLAGALDGLELAGDGSSVERLAFLKAGIVMTGEAITVSGNRFGQDWAGTATREEAHIPGVAVAAAGDGGVVGIADHAAAGNEIVYAADGVVVRGDDVEVANNIIGQGPSVGVDHTGISLIVGEGARVTFNQVVGAGGPGIFVEGFNVRGAVLEDNTVVDGREDGIQIEGGAGVVVGADGSGEGAGSGNYVASNDGRGIAVVEGVSGDVTAGGAIHIIGNRTEDNRAGGLLVEDVTDVLVGGLDMLLNDGTGPENHFADGVSLWRADGTVVEGNWISDERDTPTNPLYVYHSMVRIGGLGEGEGNTIVGSEALIDGEASAVLVEGSPARIEGNTIGADGARAFHGITIDVESAGTTVAGNTIRYHAGAGVRVFAVDVVVGGARSGATCDGPCNHIVGNTEGVRIEGHGARVLGNDIADNSDGVVVLADDVVIGGPGEALAGTCSGVCNTISGNSRYGVRAFAYGSGNTPLAGSGAHGLMVRGNFIGQTPEGADGNGTGLGLAGGAQDAVVGAHVGEADGTRGNVFVGNVGVGVEVAGAGTVGHIIRGNSFLRNGAPSIDLRAPGEAPGTPTPNDPQDADEGPNGLLNWPTLVLSERTDDDAFDLLVYWTGPAAAPASPFRIDIYADPACRGWSSDGALRTAALSFAFPRDDAPIDTVRINTPYLPSHPYYGAIITDAEGNTSEFGNCLRAGSDHVAAFAELVEGVEEAVGALLLTLRERDGGGQADRLVSKASGAAGSGLALFAVEYESEPATDTLFVPGATAVPPSGTPVSPDQLLGVAWRLASGAFPSDGSLDVCLPVGSLDEVAVTDALLVAQGAASGGRWQPFDTVLREAGGTTYACAEEVHVPGNVSLALPAQPVANEPGGPAEPLPEAPTLEAYPNPAAGSATVELALPATADVRAALFDVLGRRVALLHDGPLAAGTHPLRLDAARLPAGLYVVRATTPTAILSRRLTVVR